MIIKENGKLYNIDEETGLVTETSFDSEPEEVVVVEEFQDDFRTGDRVAVDNEEGTIISIISSVYGPAIGIQFDDGSIDEYPEERLSRVQTEEPDWETPVKEVLGKYEIYETLPAYTRDEIEVKQAEARNLNLRARALITDSKLPYADQVHLDRVILATNVDLEDLKFLRDSVEANDEYIDTFKNSQFSTSEFHNVAAIGATDDVSWVDVAFTDIEETTDADLAVAAQEMVDNLSLEQLKDDELVNLSSSFQQERLFVTEEQALKFASYVKEARAKKLAEEQPAEEVVEESDLDDFDPSSLYI